MPKRLSVPLDTLTTHPDFIFREWYLTPHLRDLRQVLSINPRKAFDPLLVWKDPADEKLCVVDGHYRAQAYREAGQGNRKVPVVVFEGTREEAVLAALRANAKATLPLNSQERLDAAWRLVRAPQSASGPRYSKPLIADASGVSERLVGYMRARWKDVQAQGSAAIEALTGQWFRDRGTATPKGDYEALSDAQRDQQIEALSKQMRDLTDRRKRGTEMPILGDQHAVYEAVSRAYGDGWIKGLFEFILGEEAAVWGNELSALSADYLDHPDEEAPPF